MINRFLVMHLVLRNIFHTNKSISTLFNRITRNKRDYCDIAIYSLFRVMYGIMIKQENIVENVLTLVTCSYGSLISKNFRSRRVMQGPDRIFPPTNRILSPLVSFEEPTTSLFMICILVDGGQIITFSASYAMIKLAHQFPESHQNWFVMCFQVTCMVT